MGTRDLSGRLGVVVGLLLLLPAPIEGADPLPQGVRPDLSDAGAQMRDSAELILVGPLPPPLYLPDRMERLLAEAGDMPALTSLIAARRGSVVVENYYGNLRPSQAVNVTQTTVCP